MELHLFNSVKISVQVLTEREGNTTECETSNMDALRRKLMLVIPGSFINAADFDSVKALADYLKYLDKNDTAYNQYFLWKTKYKVVKYQFWLCQLCKALHDPTKPAKIYHKMSEFWGVKGSCAIDKERIRDIINRG